MSSVAGLRIAPVKGLGAVAPEQVRVEVDGVAEDRRLFLVRPDGKVVTLRSAPHLTAVVPDLDLAAGTLTVRLPDGSTARSDLAAVGEAVSTRLFGKDRSGRVVPGPVADALSDCAGQPVRLVLADRAGNGWDEGPVSLLGRASAQAVGTPGGTARYRMLVDLDGTAPHEEDTWVGRQVRVGEVLLRVSHPLERCVVIDADPATGVRDWAGVRTLAQLRGRDAVTLGVIATVERPGVVHVGDPVAVAHVH